MVILHIGVCLFIILFDLVYLFIIDLFNNENTTNETVNDYGHISKDPVNFCHSRPFSHEVIEYLIIKGPFQPTEDDLINCEFAKDNSGTDAHIEATSKLKLKSISLLLIHVIQEQEKKKLLFTKK